MVGEGWRSTFLIADECANYSLSLQTHCMQVIPGNQERGPAVFSCIKMLAVLFPPSVYIEFSFVRASGESPRSAYDNYLEDKRDGCFLGKPTRRRPDMPAPAPPRHPHHGVDSDLRPNLGLRRP